MNSEQQETLLVEFIDDKSDRDISRTTMRAPLAEIHKRKGKVRILISENPPATKLSGLVSEGGLNGND